MNFKITYLKRSILSIFIVSGISFVNMSYAEEVKKAKSDIPYYKDKKVFFGELHLHTTYSLDAYMGMTRNGPDEAYRFAKGEAMETPGGVAKLKVPLDFAAVTDHAEFLGEMYASLNPNSPYYNDPTAVNIRNEEKSEELSRKVFVDVVQAANRHNKSSELGIKSGEEGIKNAWKIINDITEKHNEPGKFTTLHGYEWSSAPDGANLHRNVIFRDNNIPDLIFTANDSKDPQNLWNALDRYEKEYNTKVLAIPHNSNFSAGLMFPYEKTYSGQKINKEWASLRSRFEPLIEVMQVKQNSEVSSLFSPDDEFANFEVFDVIDNKRLNHKNNWIREGLKIGLSIEDKVGVNPYKYGFVGGTDSHNGTPSDVEEDDAVGSHGIEDGSLDRRRDGEIAGWVKTKHLNPGSITAVWAHKNTREDIWDGLKERESYATSGPRIEVRFFAFSNKKAPEKSEDWVKKAYENGYPMGSDLKLNAKEKPSFLVYAKKDPNSGNLDRVQIIKGWIDKKGNTHEKIYNVAWSDKNKRSIDDDGNLMKVGNTVNVKKATYTNDIGSNELFSVWQDNDYKEGQVAFYYARILEIPTPRWSTYDAVKNNKPIPDDIPASIQERAWTSPIWVSGFK